MNRLFDIRPPFDVRPFDGLGLWLLVLMPAIGFALDWLFVLAFPESVSFVSWLILIGIMVLAISLDQRALQSAGANAPDSRWLILLPVYMWKRETSNKINMRIFWLYMAVLAGSLIVSYTFENSRNQEQYVQSLCPTVDKIVHGLSPDIKCVRIYNVEHAAGDRYLARVQFESGARIGITVDMNSDGSSYVTLAE